MGWKCSLIIIENTNNFIDDLTILKAIGKSNYQLDGTCTLEECMYPGDNSINIGYYNGNIIISDDYQLTSKSLERAKKLQLTSAEKGLVGLFPNSEIVTVACHSSMNFHGYSLIKKGIKQRLKTISADDDKKEFGTRFEEEIKIYDKAIVKDGVHYWPYNNDPEDLSAEDQLMENFTFKVAARRLGVAIDYEDGEELVERVTFKKYINPKADSKDSGKEETSKKAKWIKYAIIIGLVLLWQIIKRKYINN
ncbi:hypothetical protein [Psychroserpens sp. Hel_I_66]|uniref:hypothetical protein n=1 Tax=Psychroserpens sp. Hel_I_66 TaxID=1250004 RepID=UPI0006463598|nr:hypothetical protein [Psychroserpens sp. Hel_I_66]